MGEFANQGVTDRTDDRPGARNHALSVVVWGRMVKLSHSVFALPFALTSAFLAGRDRESGYPGISQLALVIVCMVAARAAAMTFNRIVDADLDARNPRAAGRPLPASEISRKQAVTFFVLCCLVFIAACSGFYAIDRNIWPIALSLPVLGYLCFYSYTKRFTRWSHFVLGSAIAISPVAAWIAIHPATLGLPAFVLMATVTFWIGGFDIIYACQDVEVDRRDGLYSLPSRLGVGPALWIARGCHLLTVLLLASLMPLAGLGTLYAVGTGIVAILLCVENSLVRADDLSRINLAFFTVNGLVSLLFAATAIADIVWR